jgi:hypothetical protein
MLDSELSIPFTDIVDTNENQINSPPNSAQQASFSHSSHGKPSSKLSLILTVLALMAFSGIGGYFLGRAGTKEVLLHNQVSPTSGFRESTMTRESTVTQELKTEVGTVSDQSDEAAMLQVAKDYCLAQGGKGCKTSLDRRKGNIASAKTESMVVLLAKDSSDEWRVVLANSSDGDICKTGSDAPQLKKLCSN